MFERKDVKKLADLARIELTEEEAKELAGELDSILTYISEIQEVASTEGALMAGEHRNVMREDSKPHESGMYTNALLKGAPQRERGYVKVKKIL